MNSKIGRLTNVAIRSVWPYENQHFTPWLAEAENLSLLAEVLGLGEIQLEGTEVSVGNFSLDILARDMSGGIVLVENQFGPTDHSHLGQLVTYLAGQKGRGTIVWIAETFREEHRAAVDWLNSNTIEGLNFFGVEIEALQIGDSKPAPRFNIVSKPNEWGRRLRRTTSSNLVGELTDRQRYYTEYWSGFGAYLAEVNAKFEIESIPRDYWCGFRMARQGFRLAALAGVRDRNLSVEIYMGATWSFEAYESLKKDTESIEKDFGGPLNWSTTGRSCKISISSNEYDPADLNSRSKQFEWLLDKMNRLSAAINPRISSLQLTGGANSVVSEEEDING
jgi:hypothetical protein